MFISSIETKNCNNFVKCIDVINKFLSILFHLWRLKDEEHFYGEKYFRGEDRSTLRWSTEVIQKPFPSTTTRLLISILVLVHSPIFHSTLHFEFGKQFGLSRHSILQCWCSVHGTSLICPLGKDPNPAKKYFDSKKYNGQEHKQEAMCIHKLIVFITRGKNCGTISYHIIIKVFSIENQ